MSEWQPIGTADPHKSVLLIAKYPSGHGWSDIYHCWPEMDGSWVRWPHDPKICPPTHWMPPPEPPK